MFSLLGKNFAFVPFFMAWTSRRVELERVFEIDGTPCCVMNGDGFVAAFPVVDDANGFSGAFGLFFSCLLLIFGTKE